MLDILRSSVCEIQTTITHFSANQERCQEHTRARFSSNDHGRHTHTHARTHARARAHTHTHTTDISP